MRNIKNEIRYIVSAGLVFLFSLNNLPLAKACGPFTVDPLFSFTKHAEYPLESYAAGRVGVVPNSYGRMSLFVFYRQLNNLPFDKNEQEAIANAMKDRIGIYWSDENDTAAENDSQTETAPDYFKNWKAARAKVFEGEQKIETDKRIPDSYQYYENCLEDSFNNAAKTLQARINAYGTNENVKEWVKGQDAVFSNCDAAAGVPETLSENFPEWLRKDRAYQIAAAKFYAADFPAARKDFEQIAGDANSVWNKTAKFVAARTYIRQASLIEVSDNNETEKNAGEEEKRKEKAALLRNARVQLEAILADASMRDFHKSAQGLHNLVKYRSDALGRRRELAETLVETRGNQNIYNDLTDYIWLLDASDSEARNKGVEIDQKAAEAAGKQYNYDYRLKLRDLPANQRENDLTDWLFTYQSQDGFAHAYEKWKETQKLHWLVAAVSQTEQNAAQTSEILSETAKIKKNSPAFATVRFHQIRLLLDNGKRAEAKQLLDEVFAADFKNLPVSSQNKFLAERMIVAENLEEFLKFAERKAATFVWSGDANEEGTDLKNDKDLRPWQNRTMFDEDSVAFFNEKMPLSVLRQAAFGSQLPEHLKKFLVVAVWTRAFALGNQAVEREFSPLVLRSATEFAPLFSKYAAAKNQSEREAAALIVILSYPTIQPYVPVGFGREGSQPTTIDSTRGNWWCVEDEADKDDTSYNHYGFNYPKNYPNFLTKTQNLEAAREQKQLKAAGNSATLLARRAVEFANRNPNFADTPEILHLAVRSTRYGCTDKETEIFSKQAFQILHKRYPNSVWTKKTPYWFG